MEIDLKNPIFLILSQIAEEKNCPVYVVGGFVRDLLLKRPTTDIDIMTIGSGIELAREFAEKAGIPDKVTVYKSFGTALVNHHAFKIEFVGARKESYRSDSRKPIVENGTLQDDQNRRDFTINALALSLNKSDYGKIIDPFGGLDDLKNRIIRTPLNPDITYSDDPLRMFRAIRFASQLNYIIENESFESIKRNKERIRILSTERITDEINKILLSPKPSTGFNLLFETGLLEICMADVANLKGAEYIDGKGHKDNFVHTLEVLDKVALNTDDLWIRWAALLHDIGKPVTKKFQVGSGWTFHGHEVVGSRMVKKLFNELKLPLGDKLKFVQKLVFMHLRPIVLAENAVTDSAVRRLLFDAGEDIDALMLLCHADFTSKKPEKIKKHQRNFEIIREKLIEIEEKDKLRNWQPPISGEMIMEKFGIGPCREVGIIKNAIREAILDGLITNTFEDAYTLMISEAEKLNLYPK